MRRPFLFPALLPVFLADLTFTPWFTSRGVAVDIARQTEAPPWLRATAELPVSSEEVFAILADFHGYHHLFAPAVKTALVLESGDGFARIHFVWPYPFPFKNRDAIVLYRAAAKGGGSFLISWKSDPRRGDPKEGVRIERVAGETRIEPLGPARCRVIYSYLGDLGGKFPAWAQERAWKEEPVLYIRAIRRRLRIPDLE